MKVFISQKMRYLSHQEILDNRKEIMSAVTKHFSEKVEFIESYKPELKHSSPITALSASLLMLDSAELVLIPKESLYTFERRGCEFEYMIAESYHKKVLFYDFTDEGVEILDKDALQL